MHNDHEQRKKQSDAIRWIIENRRPDASLNQAVKTLEFALEHDRLARIMLRDLAEPKTV